MRGVPLTVSNAFNFIALSSPFKQDDHASDIRDTGDKMEEQTLKFVHMTDVHLDLQYAGGEEVGCSFSLCCRNNVETHWTRDGESNERSGDWGSLEGNCDCPLNLAQSALTAINESISRKSERLSGPLSQSGESVAELHRSAAPDYILWTGDILPHDVWATSEEQMIETASEWTRQVKSSLSHTGIPIIPLLGNHEAVPVNL